MITCLGIVVGCLESSVRSDVLRQCCVFLKSHRYLCNTGVEFEINGEFFAVLKDYTDVTGGLFACYFNNGEIVAC